MLPLDQQDKSTIVIQMPLLIRAKVFATNTGSITNFGEFAVLVYMKYEKCIELQQDRLDF